MGDRSEFVYDLVTRFGSYGMTTDMYTLPVGTKFHVTNGGWNGEIIKRDGRKYIKVLVSDGMEIELMPDMDYALVITINDDENKWKW